MRRTLAVLAALALTVAPARAQDADSSALARVVEHIDAARFDSARASLALWNDTRAASARPRERAAADVLAARLARDGDDARDAWLGVALAHPFGNDAGLALLRVGQAAVLDGDTATARIYLNRLIDDFAGSGHAAEAHLWLSRAHSLARRTALACTSARTGLAAANSAEVTGLLRLQEARACAPGAAAEPVAAASPGAEAATQPAAASGRFAVQSGAFRTRASADALVARLRQAGLQPRLVRVPANDLMRVRVGAFAAQNDAVALRDRIRSSGFDAVVVGDANQETAVP